MAKHSRDSVERAGPHPADGPPAGPPAPGAHGPDPVETTDAGPAPDAAAVEPVDPEAAQRKQRRAKRRRLLEWPIVIALAIGVALLIRTFVFETFYIPSLSMANTLKVNDRVVVNKLSYDLHSIHRGDVVVFRKPPTLQLKDEDLIKRVIGLPGDTLSLKGNSIYVDGKKLTEPYISPDCDGTASAAGPYGLQSPLTVPSGDIFVMGDNRCESYDSRYFGPISQDLVVGRAFILVWPLSRIGTL